MITCTPNFSKEVTKCFLLNAATLYHAMYSTHITLSTSIKLLFLEQPNNKKTNLHKYKSISYQNDLCNHGIEMPLTLLRLLLRNSGIITEFSTKMKTVQKSLFPMIIIKERNTSSSTQDSSIK